MTNPILELKKRVLAELDESRRILRAMGRTEDSALDAMLSKVEQKVSEHYDRIAQMNEDSFKSMIAEKMLERL